MILTVLVVVVLCVAHDLAVLGYQRRRPVPVVQPSILEQRLRQTVLVTLKTGHTYRGALYEQDPHSLVLRGASALDADGSSVGVDGELLILRGDVDYIQRP